MKLAQAVEQYLQWRAIASGNKNTPRSYGKELGKLLEAVGADLPSEDLDLFALHRFQMQLHNSGLALESQRHALTVAKAFVKWAWNEGIYRENFAAALKGPRIPKTVPKVPTAEQVKSLLDGGCPTSWPERDRVVVEVLYNNPRVSELVALDLADRIAKDEIIVKGKGRKERKVPIGESAQGAIAAYLPTRKRLLGRLNKHTPALLINHRGGRLTVRSVWRIVNTLAKAKGLPKGISPHRLRAAYVTHMLDGGAELTKVSQLVGHAKASTTMAYCGGTNWKRTREAYDRTFNR